MKNANLNSRLFFNKYKIKKLIYQTKLSSIYEGINIKDNEPVAIKLEKKSSELPYLESEAYFLFSLKGYGIPKIITYGKSGLFRVLIEELLGLSINSLWEMKKKYKTSSKVLINNVCMIALQGLERLEYIHSKNIIHRDIKPHNFLIGKNNPELIYLIDFGFARKYRSSRTGKHIKFKWIKYTFGSLRYFSINANRGFELSRRDDLESFGYMLVYLAKQYLPWISTEDLDIDKDIRIEAIYKIKKSVTPEALCKDLPEEFAEFIRYIRKLEFEEDPKYDYLKSLFTNILIKNQQKIDFNFFWIVKKEKEKSERKNKDDKSKGKRGNSRGRLFNQIKQSLEKANNKKIISVFKLENKETTKSTEKPNENKNEIKNFKSYNKSTIEENININNLNLNEKLTNNINYKRIDLNQKDNSKIIHANILKKNDKYEESEINLKNKIDKKSYINDGKNRIGLFNKGILINPLEEQKLSENLGTKIYKSLIANCNKNKKDFKKIKSMEYKTMEERQNLNDINDNNFNQIMFGNLGDKSNNSIQNYRIYDGKHFRIVTDNNFSQSYKSKNISDMYHKTYNTTKNNSVFRINNNNNYNYNQIKSFLKIDNNKKNGNIPLNIYINKANVLKNQNNNNTYEINSNMNINQY